MDLVVRVRRSLKTSSYHMFEDTETLRYQLPHLALPLCFFLMDGRLIHVSRFLYN
jgi:hypothetical protein